MKYRNHLAALLTGAAIVIPAVVVTTAAPTSVPVAGGFKGMNW